MNATSWATLWVFFGLLVFVGILLYMKAPGRLMAALDQRSAKIRSELEEARKLREEAEALLADYKKRTSNAKAEADAIIAQAQREAEALSAEARTRIEDYVARRTRAVEQRIAQAETQAVAEVRSRAIDVAAAAAAQILEERAKGEAGDELVSRSIDQVRKSLN
jgi:F-type H+-transporting ATPase subunit b